MSKYSECVYTTMWERIDAYALKEYVAATEIHIRRNRLNSSTKNCNTIKM